MFQTLLGSDPISRNVAKKFSDQINSLGRHICHQASLQPTSLYVKSLRLLEGGVDLCHFGF
jgi:hypothetical protein